MIISLMGFMASGKSSIGRILAGKLKLNFIDLDVFIEGQEGRSIKEIFEKEGESYFRKIESTHLDWIVSNHQNLVLALGGGTPCQENNWMTINKTNSIYLHKTNDQLFERLHSRKLKRPLIANLSDIELKEFIEQRMIVRSPFYKKAKTVVDVTESKKKTADQIVTLLNQS